MAIDQNRPPYVEWEMREQEDRDASKLAGHYVGKDVPFAIITRPGTQDSLHKEAQVWLDELKVKERAGQVPNGWHQAFNHSFTEWKTGGSGEILDGMPLRSWTGLGPSTLKTLLSAGLKTVEDLATLPDSQLGAIGQGATGLKQKAIAYLAAAKDTGKMAEKLESLTTQMTQLLETVSAQTKEIERLRAFEPKAAPAKA